MSHPTVQRLASRNMRAEEKREYKRMTLALALFGGAVALIPVIILAASHASAARWSTVMPAMGGIGGSTLLMSALPAYALASIKKKEKKDE